MKPEEAIDILEEIKVLDDTLYSYSPVYMQAFETAIFALKEVRQYQLIKDVTVGEIAEVLNEFSKIGTVEECREAVEKQRAKKPKFLHMLNDIKYTAECKCGYRFTADIDCRYNPQFCSKCGVKFDWSEDSEGNGT